ncbi:DUF3592 domain-containing protein [Kitasatospora sp. NPDC087861]|uniref:DUF3592 domain-containing protein n=1 Tax=Kitasatospora sp. NPDC087861 TaxID=3364070 RepID=UPI00381941A7
MTTIADAPPPVPEDRRPSTVPEDHRPSSAPGGIPAVAPAAGAGRSGRLRERARRATRPLQRVAWAAVLVGAATTAFAPWGSTTWYDGWIGAAAAAALAALAAPARLLLRRGPRPGAALLALFNGTLLALMLCVFAGCFAFALSDWSHERDRDHAATLRVTATVTGCRSTGDSSTECTYHWSAGEHEYSTREGADHRWPDGHRVSVRIDPAHPQRAAVVSGVYWALWIAIAVGGLGTPCVLCVWWLLEAPTDD